MATEAAGGVEMAGDSGTEGQSQAPAAEHIARVAARLFAARGYDATSVREIVEAASVTKPTLYYHFGSKEGLARALLFHPLDRFAAALDRVNAEVADPVEALARLFAVSFAFMREDPDRGRFTYALFFGPRGELATSLAGELCRFGERMDAIWGAAVRRLAAAGLVPADPAALADLTDALRGLVVVSTLDYLYQGKELSDDLPARLVRNLLEGFARAGRGAAVRAGSTHERH